MSDFNHTNITVVFEPDEDHSVAVSERSVPILIVGDDINEATEQVFVVDLILISTLDAATVDLTTRPSALCRIIDNDRKYIAIILKRSIYYNFF